MNPQAARSVANRPLPAIPAGLASDAATLVLFYQYAEPLWNEAEHKRALATVLALGTKHGITGRGRCAPEGLNCTLTGSAAAARAFCGALRAWKPALFNETDFKLTDGLAAKERFKALTVRKTDELVGYGLAGAKAPALATNTAVHLEADAYHAALQSPDAVVIDVRNQYETEIGRIVPPPGGAELIDPMIRNSHEFPKWLALPETKRRLAGKSVLMYCTGGIRCERASALLSDMHRDDDGAVSTDTAAFCTAGDSTCDVNDAAASITATILKATGGGASEEEEIHAPPKEILMVRGGIERYMRTFPEGGFWRGANYLFDRRFEQRPENAAAEAPIGSCAAHGCSQSCDQYRGKFSCAGAPDPRSPRIKCLVPVLVCERCRETCDAAADDAARKKFRAQLRCTLCRQGYAGARDQALPDCVRTAALTGLASSRGGRTADGKPRKERLESATLFVGNLPFTAERSEVLETLGLAADTPLAWLADATTGLFYGSALARLGTVELARAVVRRQQQKKKPPTLRGRALRLGFGPTLADDDARLLRQGERPPPLPFGAARPAASQTLLISPPSTFLLRDDDTLWSGLAAKTAEAPLQGPESNTRGGVDSIAHVDSTVFRSKKRI